MDHGKPLRVLIVEDSQDDVLLLSRELRRSGYEVEFERVQTAETMQLALNQRIWDLVLSDFSMPDFSAPQALELLKASGLDLPFIIISGTVGEETAVAALKAGAHDFLVKGKFARLGPAIERELREAESRRQRKRTEEELKEMERLLSEAQRIGHIGSWRYDIARDHLLYSDEMYRLLEVSRKEYAHNFDAFLALIYPSDRPLVAQWMEDIRVHGETEEIEFLVFRRSSELRYIRCRGVVEFDERGKPAAFIGTAQDVTERKYAEKRIQQQIERLTALRKIDQAISSSFDLSVTLDILVSQVQSHLRVDAADVLILDHAAQTLSYVAGRGFKTDVIKSAMLQVTESQVAWERRTIHVLDLIDKPDKRLLGTPGISEGFVSYFGVPLIVKGKLKGVLELFHRSPLQTYAEWRDFLNTLAGQAAIAIDNSNLYENLQKSNQELIGAYDANIEGWSRALDLRDKETEGHTQRVTKMTVRLAREFDFPEEELLHIRWGALLHDIGKMGVPDPILLKPGELTDDEWVIMRSHAQYAYDLLKPIAFLGPALDIPYCHHEKWDGSGYPRGLKGTEIPLIARIFSVVDVWDALRSDRTYRAAWTKERTLEHIKSLSGIHFDPQVVEKFVKIIEE